MKQFKAITSLKEKIPFVAAGGVAANISVRENLTKVGVISERGQHN